MADGNHLFQGDNLEIMRRNVPDTSVDLIYLDPPFNSGVSYTVHGDMAEASGVSGRVMAFDDTWQWDSGSDSAYRDAAAPGGPVAVALEALRLLLGSSAMMAYLAMMAPRLAEMRRVLKPAGSIFLHCDPTASHYLKVLMDAVFGAENFRNEIVWYYGGRGAKAIARQFPRNHDVILMYSRCPTEHRYIRQYTRRAYTHADARRRGFRRDEQGRWFKTAPRGDYTSESVSRLEAEGRIHRTKSGRIRIKYFLDEDGDDVVEEMLVGDTWCDISDAMHIGKERVGYPTQKPEALLDRIIRAGSHEGDVVLDPFCGCGTSLIAAQRLHRRWIGIDIAPLAVSLTRTRLAAIAGAELSEDQCSTCTS